MPLEWKGSLIETIFNSHFGEGLCFFEGISTLVLWAILGFDLGRFLESFNVIVLQFVHYKTGTYLFFPQMIIEYLYVPGSVLGAWDTSMNKAKPNVYSLVKNIHV